MEKTTIAATMAVLVAILMVGSVLVPIIDIQSKETTTIMNDGAGWARYDYYADNSTDYDVDMSVASSTLTLGTQSGTASEMIAWASDVGSIICSGSDFVLLYDDNGTDAFVDLGASAGVASASGTVTVTDSTDAAAATLAPAWAYVPAAAGSFGFFDESGATVKDFPMAAAGSLAGVYAYNNFDSLDFGLVSTSSTTGGVFNVGVWETPEADNTVIGAACSGNAKVALFNANIDPSTGTQVDNLYYTFTGIKATVTGISSSIQSSSTITIPDTVTSGGTTYEVTKIGTSVFSELTTLENVVLPSGLTSIEYGAFAGCTNLALTSLPSGLTALGSDVFNGCTNLALTSLPSGLTSIGNSAFRGCTNLALTSLPSGLTSIGTSVFNGCTNLALTSLPSSLTSIKANAFSGCTNLALTSLPSGLTSIGNSAFNNCTGISDLVLLGSPTIGDNAFYGTAIGEFLNLGSTEISAGDYGLSADAQVRNDVPAIGYVAPVSYSETVQKEGAEYDLMAIIPIMVIAGILMASAVMFGLMHRND